MSDAVTRIRDYIAAAEHFAGDDDSLDRVPAGGEIHDLTLADLREVLDLAMIYEDLRNS